MYGLTTVVEREVGTAENPKVLTIVEIPICDKLLTVHMIRAAHLPEDKNSVLEVKLGQEELFCLRGEGYTGVGRLYLQPEPLIAVCNLVSDNKTLKDVILNVLPLKDLLASTFIDLPGGIKKRIGMRSAELLYDLKMELSRTLRQKCELSQIENIIQARRLQARQVQAEFERQENERLHQERIKRIEAINSRQRIDAYGPTGKHYNGLPVLANEVQSVRSGTHVIITDADGHPLEYFYLAKKHQGGRMEMKGNTSELSLTKPAKPTESRLAALQELFFDLPLMGLSTVMHYEGGQGIVEKLIAKGINSGTCVAIGNQTSAGEFEIHCLKDGGSTTIGHFKPLDV